MPRLRILNVVSECVPFAKTGGLADVAGALPMALAARGHDVRVVMPRYRITKKHPAQKLPFALGVPVGHGEAWGAAYETKLGDSDARVYFRFAFGWEVCRPVERFALNRSTALFDNIEVVEGFTAAPL